MRFSRSSLLGLLNSPAKLKITKFLLTHEASMSEREIASILKLSHMSVNRMLRELAAVNLASYAAVGKAHLWKVNKKSFSYAALRQLTQSLEQIPDPLMRLKGLLLKHLAAPPVKRIVLFGSVAKSLEHPDSDIDLFILVANNRDEKKLEKAIEELSNECLEIFGNRLSPYVLTEREFSRRQRSNIVTEINSGIPIYPQEKS